MNLVEILLQHAADQADQPALIEGPAERSRTLSYGQLAVESARAAAMFRASGLARGDRVLLLSPMSIDLYVALLGLWRVGAVAMVVDPGAGVRHLRHCCQRGRPEGLIGVGKAHLLRFIIGPLRGLPHRWVTGGVALAGPRFDRRRRFAPDDRIETLDDAAPALLTFTSGSTDLPKAAVRTHGFLRGQYEALAPAIDLHAGEVDLATLPIFALANLAAGATTLIPDADLRRIDAIDPQPILAQFGRHRPTRCTASPAFFERLIAGGRRLDGLAKVFTGGAPVFASLLDRLAEACPQARIVALYGSTEAEPIAELDCATVEPADRQRMHSGHGLLAGRPVPQIDLRVLADHSGLPLTRLEPEAFEAKTLGADEPGEIVVTGRHVLSGYLDGVGDDQAKIHVGDRVWHRTGDAGYLDAAGRLWLLGRASEKATDDRGVMYSFAVECAADVVAGVRRTALVPHRARRLLVVQAEAAANDHEAIQRDLRQALAWARIDRFVFADRIPLDRRHSGKVDHPALRRWLASLD